MYKLLGEFGIWLIKQQWFRTKLVHFITNAVEKTETQLDDKIVAFIAEHRRQLVTILNKEVQKTDTVIDDRLIEAIQTVPTKK